MNELFNILICLLELIMIVPVFLIITVLIVGAIIEAKDYLRW